MKRYLVVGSGGREHALAWKLASGGLNEVWVAPGNPGIAGDADIAGCLPVDVLDIDGLVKLARDKSIDLTVVGPEAPLCAGVVDRFRLENLAVFGPTAAAARLEESKAFSKNVMDAAGVKTAGYRVFDELAPALEHIAECTHPVVIKADGLAGGKGVVISPDTSTSEETLRSFMQDGRFGDSSSRVVIEDFLVGPEVSFICITDGTRVLPLATSRDHKRVGEGDTGPNTGGMGAITPAPQDTPEFRNMVIDDVIRPVLAEMKRRNSEFTGFLYAGLMMTADGPYVLEFNVRMGDPETQPLLFAMEGALGPALEQAAAGQLDLESLGAFDAACCVVLASRGYPGTPDKGFEIQGLDTAFGPNVKVFHAGTGLNDEGKLVNSGGRVLGVTARGANVQSARENAYAAVARIDWDGMHFRRDIGK